MSLAPARSLSPWVPADTALTPFQGGRSTFTEDQKVENLLSTYAVNYNDVVPERGRTTETLSEVRMRRKEEPLETLGGLVDC